MQKVFISETKLDRLNYNKVTLRSFFLLTQNRVHLLIIYIEKLPQSAETY